MNYNAGERSGTDCNPWCEQLHVLGCEEGHHSQIWYQIRIAEASAWFPHYHAQHSASCQGAGQRPNIITPANGAKHL